MRIFIFISIILISTSAYTQDSSNELHRVTVKESIQTNSYTYLLVEENDSEWWIAAPKMTPVSDAVYYYLGEMKMKNFHSKELDRDFESVTFVEDLVFEEIYRSGKYPIKGGVTIANLFINKDEYDGQVIKVRGKVTKYNDNIMGKNWIHLNDGTNVLGNRDFVVTSSMTTKVGEIITVKGKIFKHVDLGHGYKYEILMEEATIEK